MVRHANVRVGDQVYTAEGGDPCGAVREVRPSELVVDIEGHGDFVVEAAAVSAVHDAKVVLDVRALPEELRNAIAHAHDEEEETENAGRTPPEVR